MIQFSPIVLAIVYALVTYKFSAWKTKRDLDKNSNKLDDRKLKNLNTKMAKALDLPDIKVNVYEISPINGLAAPDGRIFITRGFIDKYISGDVSAEEMASVIAHEIGHVALGHTRKRLIDFSGQNVVRVLLTSVLGRLVPGVGIWIANSITTLLAAKLSRNDEYEADAYASALLIKSGIVKKDSLIKLRPYLIILFFVIGMLLTPPDIFSQLFLAIPMWILFELGLLVSRDKP